MNIKINNITIILFLLSIIVLYLLYNTINTPLNNNKTHTNNVINTNTQYKNNKYKNEKVECNYKREKIIPQIISEYNINNIPSNNNTIYHDKIFDPLEGPGIHDAIFHPKILHNHVDNRINIKTRGMPTEYQQLGYLTNVDDVDDVKPLYGRQTYSGSKSWNYYSSTDTHLSIKIPVYTSNNKCTDERGCNELNEVQAR